MTGKIQQRAGVGRQRNKKVREAGERGAGSGKLSPPCPPPLHDFLIFSNRTASAWSVKAGNICSVSVFFVRVDSQISRRRGKKDSNIPSPGRTRSVKCPTPGPTKTIKSPPHALTPPPPSRRLYIDRCINEKSKLLCCYLTPPISGLSDKLSGKLQKLYRTVQLE